MSTNNTFFRIASIAAALTAVTTFLLWLLPYLYESPTNVEEGILLTNNDYYLARQWVNFIHIPLALTGYFGLTLIQSKKQKALSVFGMGWFAIWGAIEMIGVSIILFSVNYNWRSNYHLADELQKLVLKNNIETFFSIWDSLFFVLLIAFLLGTLFFAWATSKSKGLEKVLSYLLWLAVPLTIFIILSRYFEQEWAGQITTYLYPILQPVSRFVLGIFIWKSIEKKNYD
jgi:membrane-anchored protein YejM (alkaline phosphatase superfamily)